MQEKQVYYYNLQQYDVRGLFSFQPTFDWRNSYTSRMRVGFAVVDSAFPPQNMATSINSLAEYELQSVKRFLQAEGNRAAEIQ